jgi:DNA invertase Pin-like site-specific DNA recombinase
VLRKGDVLVVWKLDRLARSLKKLITTAEDLEERGIGLVSLTESIDTTTPGGVLVFHVFGAIAQFERALIRERTTAGFSRHAVADARVDAHRHSRTAMSPRRAH